MSWINKSCIIPSVLTRNRLYAPAVSSNNAPESPSEPTWLEVRSATSSILMGPARFLLVLRLARSCNSSHNSRKNCDASVRGAPSHSTIVTYNIVTPVAHLLLHILRTSINSAESLQAFNTLYVRLIILPDTLHSPGNRRRQGKISLETGLESIMKLVEDGDLNINQKPEFLREGS